MNWQVWILWIGTTLVLAAASLLFSLDFTNMAAGSALLLAINANWRLRL